MTTLTTSPGRTSSTRISDLWRNCRSRATGEVTASSVPGCSAKGCLERAADTVEARETGGNGTRRVRTHSRSMSSQNCIARSPSPSTLDGGARPIFSMRRSHAPMPSPPSHSSPVAASRRGMLSGSRAMSVRDLSSTVGSAAARCHKPLSSSPCSWSAPHPAYPTNTQKSSCVAKPLSTSHLASAKLVTNRSFSTRLLLSLASGLVSV
mmetsp:Transcript_5839/g.13397  ORF Transcript_5839/g.13397 Transcript_5839/m.13397 type:complete len:208 (+) Transcript_5839:790-1413(+)